MQICMKAFRLRLTRHVSKILAQAAPGTQHGILRLLQSGSAAQCSLHCDVALHVQNLHAGLTGHPELYSLLVHSTASLG